MIFVHGSGSSMHSTRNQYLSEVLIASGISTLLIDLLSNKEAEIDNKSREYRFNIELLTHRLLMITDTVSQSEITKSFKFGYFGSSTGAAVAIRSAIQRPNRIITIVSRSGRHDLLDPDSIMNLRASILLLVGSRDLPIVDTSLRFIQKLEKDIMKKMILIPGASHLFDEPGKIEQIGRIVSVWFRDKLSHK